MNTLLKINIYKHFVSLFLSLIINLSFFTDLFAFRDVAHQNINKSAVEIQTGNPTGFNFDNFAKGKLGFDYGINERIDYFLNYRTWSLQPITAKQIIVDAGPSEDKFPRFFRHFHDAIGNHGLWSIFPSAITWAQLPEGQGYSWSDARRYYYTALTAKETYNRNANFALAFRSVGQVMHLVADMAVPEHVRNDAHPLSPGIELYVDKTLNDNPFAFDNALGRPFFFDFKTLQTTPSAFTARGAPVPIANLFDRDIYSGTNPDITTGNKIGLAEYSNANFLSTDTNPVDKDIVIPPRLTSTTPSFDEKTNRWYHVKDRDGETGERPSKDGKPAVKGYKLTAMSVHDFHRHILFGVSFNSPTPLLDNAVYEDYAYFLLPRAVGYAATALNYFFRGEIELSLPDQGFYANGTVDDSGFSQIRVNARNVTVNDEEMPEGSVELVIKHKMALQDPFQGFPVPVSEDFSYIVVPEANGVTGIPQGSDVELVFNLPEGVPYHATDVTLQVVYRGKLGFQSGSGFVGEMQGVGVGFLDISEPTPVDYINGMDLVCFNGEILLAGSAEALDAIDAAGVSSFVDFYRHNIANSYLKYSPQESISYASPSNYDVAIPSVPAGHYARHFLLIEPYGSYVRINNQMQPVSSDSRDTFIHMVHRATRFIQGMINQVVVEDGVGIRYYSGMSDNRGIKTWGGVHWVNQSYPSNSVCSFEESSIPLAGPVPVELNN